MPTFVFNCRWFVLALGLLCLSACSSVRLVETMALPLTPIVTTLPSLTQTALRELTQEVSLTTPISQPTHLSPTPKPDVSPTPAPASLYIDVYFSVDGQYMLECGEQFTRLTRAADKQLLWELASPSWCYPAEWAENAPVLAFALQNNAKTDYYVWQAEEPTPRVVAQASAGPGIWWAPDASRFAIFDSFWNEEGYYEAGRLTLTVIHVDGRPPLRTEADFLSNDSGESLHWLTNNIFWIWHGAGACCSAYLYFDANTGEEIPGWYNSFDLSQAPSYSPDLRWRVTDNSYRLWEGEAYASPSYYHHRYEILNFQTRHYAELLATSQQHLQFVDWTEDSRTFYLISRPTTATSLNAPNVPFGLLALNTETYEFTQLFEQAVFAKLSPDKGMAWVVFPVRREDGTLGLDGGIFNLADGTLTGRTFVSDNLVYANPAEGDLVPVAWSHDGTQLVFGDVHGNLQLVNTTGEIQTLKTDLPPVLTSGPKSVRYEWSEDDRSLKVWYGEQAWNIILPEP